MTTFATSDLHLRHANIQSYCPTRPQGSMEDHDETIIRNWNATVAPDDVVWVLGDVAMGKIAESLPLVKRLNGTKLLIPGNHDRCWWAHKPAYVEKWTPIYQEVGFAIFNVRERLRVNEWGILKMSHFPYEGDHTGEERYSHARPTDEGHVLLHGHVHDAWKVKRAESGSVQINVGLDVWDYRPVAIEELLALV